MAPASALKPANAGVALHHQVYLVLRDLLLAGTYQAGEQLPIEPELARQFGVSRITLRRAVQDLQRDGHVERIQGRGTFVRAVRGASPARASANFVFDLRHLAATTVEVLEFEQVGMPQDLARRFGTSSGAMALRSVRVRQREKQPIMLLAAWVPLHLATGITRMKLQKHSLVALLAKNGVRFGRVLQEFKAVLSDPVQASRLRVPIGTALLQVDRTLHDHRGRPVGYVRAVVTSSNTLMVIDTPAELVNLVSTGHFVRNIEQDSDVQEDRQRRQTDRAP
jgi:GntR family transcriptional regulator